MSITRKFTFGLLGWVSATSLLAQLPTARLLTVFPPGGRAGSTCEVVVAGIDLEGASALFFSHSNITAAVNTNGTFAVSIGTNVPARTYDARVIGRFGISNPRAFVVGELDEVAESDSTELSLGMTVNGRAEANGVDQFKLRVKQGQRVRAVCEARNIDSRLDPSLIVYDSAGRELERSRRGGVLEFTAAQGTNFVLKVHDFLYGGGSEHFYRLSLKESDTLQPEPKPEAEMIKPPCEMEGRFYPAGDVDWYSFEAKKGDVYWLEVFSQRLGWPTDPLVVIGEQEFNDSEANVGGVEFKTSSLDPVGRFEAKEDGKVRMQVRDLFNRTVSDPRHAYRLVLRKETPDFRLLAMPQGPPPKKDTREALVWTSVLRRGETIPIKVIALRQDGFKDAISVPAMDLPPGVTSSELTIPGDKSTGILLITAAETATNWSGMISIGGQRKAQAATVIWNVGDYNTEPVRSRLADNFALGVCNELAPISVAAETLEAPASGKVSIPLKITRRGEFNEAFKLKAQGLAALDSLKEIEVKEKGTNAMVELDLSQQKLSPGTHTFYLQGQTKGKYGEKPKDVTITVYSAPITLKVPPPQTAAK